MRLRTARRRLAGICKECLQPAGKGFTRCFKHHQRDLKGKWKRRLTRFDALVDTMAKKGYISSTEATESGMTARMLRYYCWKGKIQAVKLGMDRRWWVNKASLKQYLNSRNKSTHQRAEFTAFVS